MSHPSEEKQWTLFESVLRQIRDVAISFYTSDVLLDASDGDPDVGGEIFDQVVRKTAPSSLYYAGVAMHRMAVIGVCSLDADRGGQRQERSASLAALLHETEFADDRLRNECRGLQRELRQLVRHRVDPATRRTLRDWRDLEPPELQAGVRVRATMKPAQVGSAVPGPSDRTLSEDPRAQQPERDMTIISFRLP